MYFCLESVLLLYDLLNNDRACKPAVLSTLGFASKPAWFNRFFAI